jgi:hypothetical protein
MPLNRSESLVGASHGVWCYHRLQYVVLSASPLIGLLSNVSLSAARVILRGVTIDFGVLPMAFHY